MISRLFFYHTNLAFANQPRQNRYRCWRRSDLSGRGLTSSNQKSNLFFDQRENDEKAGADVLDAFHQQVAFHFLRHLL